MAELDPDQEIRRLTVLYAGMEDSQLIELAEEGGSLTDEARQALRGEIAQRRLEARVADPPPVSVLDWRKLVTVARFRDTPDALLAKGRLEAEGIESFFANENLIRLDWFISNLVGGIKLLVDEDAAEEARAILGEPIPAAFDIGDSEAYQQPACPRCGSLDIGFQDWDKRFALPPLWFGIPVPITRKSWKCSSCRSEWKEETDPEREEEQKEFE